MSGSEIAPGSSRPPGTLITFEGVEGSGKSTQARLLEDSLRAAGHEVVACREPGGTPLGEAIRGHVLADRQDPPVDLSELFLMEAARAQLVRCVIGPALTAGRIVISDRYADASLAYQWGGRGLPRDFVEACNGMAMDGCLPARTILLDLDPEAGLRRLRAGGIAGDRMEGEGLDFHRRVAEAYRRLAAEDPGRFLTIDAERPVVEIATEIRTGLEALFGRLPDAAAREGA